MAQTQNIGTLLVQLLFKDDQLDAGLKKAKGSLGSFADHAKSAASAVDTFVTAAFKRAALAAAAFSTAIAVTGAGFERTMSEVQSKTQATTAELDAMSKTAREIGATTAYSAQEAAAAMVLLGQAGFSTGEIIQSTGQIMYLAGANATSLETAASIAAAALRVFALDASEAARVADVFTAATNASQLTLEDLGTAMRYAGTIAHTLGFSIEETTAALGAFRDMGLTGEQVGTTFRAMMEALVRPTKPAIYALDKLKLKFEDLDPQLQDFKSIVDKLAATSFNAADSIQIFGVVAGGAVANLVEATREGRSGFESLSATIEQSGGAAARAYATMLDNVYGRWKILTSSVQELALVAFESMKGPLNRLLEGLTQRVQAIARVFKQSGSEMESSLDGVVDWVLKFTDSLIRITPYLDDIAIAMAAAWVGAKGVTWTIAITQLVSAMATAVGGLAALKTALLGLAATITTTTGGIALLVVGIGAAVTALAMFAMRTKESREEQEKLNAALDASKIVQGENEERSKRVAAALKAQQIQATTLLQRDAEATDAAQKLTAAERARLEGIRDLTVAQAIQEEREGKLILTGEGLARTQDLIAKGGKEGEAIAKGRVATLKDEIDDRNRLIAALDETEIAFKAMAAQESGAFERYQKARKASEALAEQLGETSLAFESGDNAVQNYETNILLLAQRNEQAEAEVKALNEEISRGAQAKLRAAEADEKAGQEHQKTRLELIAEEHAAETAEATIARLADTLTRTTAILKAADIPDDSFLDPTKMGKGANLAQIAAEKIRAALGRIRTAVSELAGDDLPLAEALELYLDPAKLQREALRAGKSVDEINSVLGEIQAAFRDAMEGAPPNYFLDPEKVKREGLIAGKSADEIQEAVRTAQAAIAELQTGGGEGYSDVIPGIAIGEFSEQLTEVTLTAGQRFWKGLNEEGEPQKLGETIADGMEIVEGKLKAALGIAADFFGAQMLAALNTIGAAAQKLGAQIVAPIGDLLKEARGILDVGGLFGTVNSEIAGQQEAFDEYWAGLMEQQNAPSISGQREGYVEPVSPPDPKQIARDTVQAAADGIIAFAQGLADTLPVIFREIVKAIPDIVEALIAALPRVFQAIANALPGLVEALLNALPSLITTIANGVALIISKLPEIVTAIVAALPDIITAIVEAIPVIINALVEAIPEIVTAIIVALPDIILALIKGIPSVIWALISAIPRVIIAIIGEIPNIIGALIAQIPAFFEELGEWALDLVADIFDALLDAVTKVGEAFVELITLGLANTSLDGKKTSDGKRTSADFFGELFSAGFKNTDYDHEGEPSGRAFSGIEYVPFTMSRVLEPGEAVIDAATNAQRLRGRPSMPSPAVPAGGGAMHPLEIVMQANGQTLDVVLAEAGERGQAPRLKRQIRNASGTRIGVSRGKFNPWAA